MANYILRRLLHMIPTLALMSVLSFVIIQAPPGDMLSTKIARLQEEGQIGATGAAEQIQALRERYHLDEPLPMQYLRWIGGIVLRGDLGESFTYEMNVTDLFRERLGLTFLLAAVSLLFTWVVAVPIGIYSAMRPYSFGDYAFTFLGFIGVATPGFLLALLVMYFQARTLGTASVGGLMSQEFIGEPWSLAKVRDLLTHIWVPVIVIGTSGTAALIRIMRGNLLDVLTQQHIQTGRAKGLTERFVVWKYGVRIAVNPLISRIGLELPNLLSGAVVISIVLGLPTAGPLFLNALTSQDMYLAGAFLLLSGVFLLIGNLLADIVLAWLDPRIRYE